MFKDGIDLSIRVGWLKDSSQRATKLSDVRQCVVAAPNYFSAHGIPKKIEELSQHQWIALSLLSAPLTWTFQHNRRKQTILMQSRIRVDTTSLSLAKHILETPLSIV